MVDEKKLPYRIGEEIRKRWQSSNTDFRARGQEFIEACKLYNEKLEHFLQLYVDRFCNLSSLYEDLLSQRNALKRLTGNLRAKKINLEEHLAKQSEQVGILAKQVQELEDKLEFVTDEKRKGYIKKLIEEAREIINHTFYRFRKSQPQNSANH